MATGGIDKKELTEGAGFGLRYIINSMISKFPTINHISTKTLNNWIDSKEKKLILLDCREPEEYEVSHVPDAVRVDWGRQDIEQLVNSLSLTKKDAGDEGNKAIVCYCSLGFRGCTMAKKIKDFFNKKDDPPPVEVNNLAGALIKWANEGRPLVDGKGQKTVYCHPHLFLMRGFLNKAVRKW